MVQNRLSTIELKLKKMSTCLFGTTRLSEVTRVLVSSATQVMIHRKQPCKASAHASLHPTQSSQPETRSQNVFLVSCWTHSFCWNNQLLRLLPHLEHFTMLVDGWMQASCSLCLQSYHVKITVFSFNLFFITEYYAYNNPALLQMVSCCFCQMWNSYKTWKGFDAVTAWKIASTREN